MGLLGNRQQAMHSRAIYMQLRYLNIPDPQIGAVPAIPDVQALQGMLKSHIGIARNDISVAKQCHRHAQGSYIKLWLPVATPQAPVVRCMPRCAK